LSVVSRGLKVRDGPQASQTDEAPFLKAEANTFMYYGLSRSWYLAYALLTAVADVSLSVTFILACLRLRRQTFDARTQRSLAIMLSKAIQGWILTAACSIGMAIAALVSRDTSVSVSCVTLGCC
jgi:hypothetical protein